MNRKFRKLHQKNAQKIKEQIKQIQTPDGSFSHIGMWKIRTKLFPRQTDPPMAKKDTEENIITGPEALKKVLFSKLCRQIKTKRDEN